MDLINEERRSDIEYEVVNGKPYLVLNRPSSDSGTVKCPFCGKRHSHGASDGHKIAHCASSVGKGELTALDGTKLFRVDGYVLRSNS